MPKLRRLIKSNGDRKKIENSRRTVNQCVSPFQFNQLRKMEMELKLVPQYQKRVEYSTLKQAKKDHKELEERF
jgi:hypothetical protein